MLLAVLSDIHGNGDALGAVLSALRSLPPHRVLHLGDLAGYNAEPAPCVRWAMDGGVEGVEGNHDAVASGKEEGAGFNPDARDAALWARERLSPPEREYLASLPARVSLPGGILLCHGAPSDRDRYLLAPSQAGEELLRLPGEVRWVLCGHTHVPGAFVLSPGGTARFHPPALPLRLASGERAVANPGSVGQPRDRDPRGSFLLLDTESGEVRWHRVAYDAEGASRKVREAGLPPFLAARLLEGI
jgi:diadenosine tetraphosphatase ApaH/serine/threonine PP2A family protein phosphatase